MKLIELGIDFRNQLKDPQSPGSRGIALNKNKHDYAKDKELAKTWEEHEERVANMKVANG